MLDSKFFVEFAWQATSCLTRNWASDGEESLFAFVPTPNPIWSLAVVCCLLHSFFETSAEYDCSNSTYGTQSTMTRISRVGVWIFARTSHNRLVLPNVLEEVLKASFEMQQTASKNSHRSSSYQYHALKFSVLSISSQTEIWIWWVPKRKHIRNTVITMRNKMYTAGRKLVGPYGPWAVN